MMNRRAQNRLPSNAPDPAGNEAGSEVVSPTVSHLKQVRINEGDLAYSERGTGDLVILVHGALGDYRIWSSQFAALSQQYHVISYSRRYHQPNLPADEATDYTHRGHVDDLIALIEALQLGPAHLVGHCYGGAVAAVLALKRPEMVSSLVLAEPSLFSMISHPQDRVSLRLHGIALNVVQKLTENAEQELAVREYVNIALGKDGYDDLSSEVQLVVNENGHTLGPMLRTYFEPTELDRSSALNIKTPTLLIAGESSSRLYHAIIRQLEKCVPNSELLTLSGTSYGLQTADSTDFNEAVLEFLSRNEMAVKQRHH
jgi:pimeloyl-ACP methyl ester carboxylesterase